MFCHFAQFRAADPGKRLTRRPANDYVDALLGPGPKFQFGNKLFGLGLSDVPSDCMRAPVAL
jgi:hypothetical protein